MSTTRSRTLTLPIDGMSLAINVAGEAAKPALLLLHGWPQSRALYDGVLDDFAGDFHVLVPDLPAIGESRRPPPAADKATLADIVLRAAEKAGARDVVVAGLDIGGMIAFAAAREHGARIAGAVVMNTAIPGLDPWDRLVADPEVWHFAFHALPQLPETLVQGRQRAYFDFFHDFLAGDPKRIPPVLRDTFARAYARFEALEAGFDWYRALPADAQRNAESKRIETPILYVRGDADGRPIQPYLDGLRAGGVRRLDGRLIADCGELAPVEQPSDFVAVVREFARDCASHVHSHGGHDHADAGIHGAGPEYRPAAHARGGHERHARDARDARGASRGR
jgi:pimeloyl-ACP methyl ester carboxylesterase